MGKIDVEFGEALRKAKQIEENGDSIKSTASKIAELEGAIGGFWKGDSAGEYLKKYDKHARKLVSYGQSLKTNAEKLKESTNRLKRAEEWGASLFSRR